MTDENSEQTDTSEPGRNAALFFGGTIIGFSLVVIIGLFVIAVAKPTNSSSTASGGSSGGDGGSQEVPSEGELSTSVETPDSVEAEFEVIATEFAYDPDPVVIATTSKVTLHNEGAVLHNLVIEGIEDFVLEADSGETVSADMGLNAGEYVIFCSIPGHRDAGMESTLIVE